MFFDDDTENECRLMGYGFSSFGSFRVYRVRQTHFSASCFMLLPSAKLAGLAAEKLGQPAAMGELIAGMLLGNLGFLGLHGLDYLKTDPGIEILGADR
jgi:hypothetical protein